MKSSVRRYSLAVLPSRFFETTRDSPTIILIGIVVVAVFLRVASALYLGDTVEIMPGVWDQVSYDTLARQVWAGHGFQFPSLWWPATRAHEPTGHWSYLYTLYLAGVYTLFGLHPLVARLIQAIIAGILHPWLAWRLGRRLFGPSVGLLAAGLSAIYLYFAYYAGTLMTETFHILATLAALDIATAIAQREASQSRTAAAPRQSLRESAGPWVALGLALGVAILMRQILLLFVPFLFVWLFWARGKRKGAGVIDRGDSTRRFTLDRWWRSLVGPLVTVGVLAAMIAPWTVRNYLAFDRFVLLNTNAGFAFYWANHPIYGTRFVTPLPQDGPSYVDLIPPDLLQLNEADMDRALLREGLRFVVEDPARYALLSIGRAWWFFRFWPIAASDLISNVGRFFSYGAFLPFMVYGLFLSSVHWRQFVVKGQRRAVVLLYLFMIFYTLIHLLSWSLVRYRLPVDAVLLVFAALAIKDIIERLARVEALRSIALKAVPSHQKASLSRGIAPRTESQPQADAGRSGHSV